MKIPGMPCAGNIRWPFLVSVVTYVAAVVLANMVTDQFGLVTVGFGLMVTAGVASRHAGLPVGRHGLPC